MTVYDFKELSPLDFEELIRDLLQAEWKCRLESFGPGKDRGVDIRFLDGPYRTVIQAKHWKGSGSAALVRAMKKERYKAISLDAQRYLLATSLSMTPDLKQKIVDVMPGVPLEVNDILGLEDLNNLLKRHEEVERKHFKLWLSSSAVLERILLSGVYNRTGAEMDLIKVMVPRFVHNDSVADAEKLLNETGALIIAGEPGVGKTTLARILLWRHAEQEWKIFVVDSIEEALEVASEGSRRLIFFDDFLGQVRLSPDYVRGIDARLPPLLARVAAHKNLRFVLTTRDYILAQAKTLSGRLALGTPDARQYVLNVGSYTRGVKARILHNHLYFSDLSEDKIANLLDDAGVHFTNPGLRDFLEGVILEDRLVGVLLPEIGSYRELSECLAIAKTAGRKRIGLHAPAKTWIDAFDRLASSKAMEASDQIHIAIALFEELDAADFLSRVSDGIDLLEFQGLESGDVDKACSIIEESALNGLPPELAQRLASVATTVGATLLSRDAQYLSFEEIQSLDHALFTYGNNKDLALGAIHDAIDAFERHGLGEELSELSSLGDLEEFEKTVMKLANSRGYVFWNGLRDIDRRRERLREDNDRDFERGGYSSSGARSGPTMTTDEIRSMFGGLRER